MRLNLPKKFRLKDTIAVEDPLGMGWTWRLRYYGNPAHAQHLQDQGGTGAFDDFVELQQKCVAAAHVDAANQKLRGKVQKDFVAKRAAELYQQRVFDLDVAKIDAEVSNPESLAEFVVADIAGVEEVAADDTIVAVAYSQDLALDIFGRQEPLPFDYEDGEDEDGEPEFFVAADTPLGMFYRRWVTWKSQNAAAFRESELEAAGKA